MKTHLIHVIVLALTVSTLPASSQHVTKEEALTVANNWVTLVIRKGGSWGGFQKAGIRDISEFKQGTRTVGYYCRVLPTGNIIIPKKREFSPIAAYSENSDIDPSSDKLMAGFIKRNMAFALSKMEKHVGIAELAGTKDAQAISKSKQKEAWVKLEKDFHTFASELDSGVIAMDYQPDTYLLSSKWHQRWPYNDECLPGDECENTLVGCVALAGAQIMRYWAWPPNDFEWTEMPDSIYGFYPPVSYLCERVGYQAGTDYGCNESTAWVADKPGKDMLDAYEDQFSYDNDAYFDIRGSATDSEWHNIIKNNINQNKPLQYATADDFFPGVAGHSMVLDGWKELNGTFYGHMNDGILEWVDMESIAGVEGMIKNIKPVYSLGTWLSGDPPDDHVQYYIPSFPFTTFPYRYFDQDATGRNVTFADGHKLQFLPGVIVRGTSPIGDFIQFVGNTSDTKLFSIKGTSTGGLKSEVVIYDGEIRLYNNGSIKFH